MRSTFALLLALLSGGCSVPADWGCNALIHPQHRPSTGTPPGAQPFAVEVAPHTQLRGWLARGIGKRRGLILWLHGVGDNKDGGASLMVRYQARGFDVAAYDARAHGESGGADCTYGFYEKRDVSRVLDVLAASGADVEHTLLLGHSMGAAVALQAAPLDRRVIAVIAAAPFATLLIAANELKPSVMSRASFDAAGKLAEERAHFRIGEVSPEESARELKIPLLLVHGDADDRLSVGNSRRILAAAGSADKKLIVMPGFGHDDLLGHNETWMVIDHFVDRVMP